MIRRILVSVAAVAAAVALTPAAHAGELGCPPGTYSQWSGLYNPRTGEPLMVCFIHLPPI